MDFYSWIILGRQAANIIESIIRSAEYWIVYILDEVRPRFEVNINTVYRSTHELIDVFQC